jgi:hypothetical protein
VSRWRIGVEVKMELYFQRGLGVTEMKQRPETKVYWMVQKQSDK